MPLLIFTCSLFVYYLFEKKVKMILLLLSFSILLIFLIIKFPFINRLDIQIKNFYSDTVRVIKISPKLFYKNVYDDHHLGSTGYLLHFNSGVQLWKKNKIFGNGFKSLPLYCNYEQNTTCNTHPHNYFIEIIMDAGIVGIILIYFVFLKGLKNFYYFYFSKIDQKMKFISLPFFLLFFLNFFL